MSEQPQYQPPADAQPAFVYNQDPQTQAAPAPAPTVSIPEAYRLQPLPDDRAKPISEARAALPNPEDRTTSRPDNIRQPQDRKKSKLYLKAERDAMLDADGKLPFEWDGKTYRFDPELLGIRFQILCEDGKPASAIRHLLGTEQFAPLMDYSIDDLEGILEAIGKIAQMGNS